MNINFSAEKLHIEISNPGDPEPLLSYNTDKYSFSLRLPELLVALQDIVKVIEPKFSEETKYDFFAQAKDDEPLYKGNGNDNARHGDLDRA